jgi:hypothetical protein
LINFILLCAGECLDNIYKKNNKELKIHMREMVTGTMSKDADKCARCQQIGAFMCEHKTPVRDKYRSMVSEHGKFYESPRDYEDLLQPSIYHEPNAFGGDSALHSHNALSFQRLLLNQKKFESELNIKKAFELNKAHKKKEKKKQMKLNSLRPSNQSLIRLSKITPRSTPRNSIKRNGNKKNPIRFTDEEFFQIPSNSANGNSNNNQLPNGKNGSNKNNNNISVVSDLDGDNFKDVENDKPQKETIDKKKKDDKGGCCGSCTIL